MNFFVFLLSICVVACYVNAQYQPYHDDRAYYYPNFPVADGRTPNSVYDNRFFYRTSTTTATTTTTTTCTVKAANNCLGGRRRRFLEDDDDSIEPSPVNKVEVTEVAELDSVRPERKADPQYSFWRGGFSPSYELRSTFGQQTPFPVYYNQYIGQPVVIADTRLLLNYYAFTTTSTSTVTVTSRSTPICSQGSGFNPC